MKLSCNQENLSRGLNIIGKIIGTRGNLPVLNNVLLSTDNGRLKLSSTDLEIGINTWIGAKIQNEGSITIPARLLIDYVNTNNDIKINLEQQNENLKLNSNKYKAHIKGISATEFPLIPKLDKNLIVQINAKKFQTAISKVIFAAATDETRPVLTGLLLNICDNILKIAATDSYRLAQAIIKLEINSKQKKQIIIPTRTMAELNRIISIVDPVDVKIYLSENQISFVLGDTQIISRLIEGNYPDYEQIIPEKFTSKIIIPIKEFANAIKMASFFARESANNIKFIVGDDNAAKVSAISPQVGDSVSEVILEKKEGEKLEIAFNSKYVLDAINAITDKNLVLEASGSQKPAMLKSEKSKDYFYIIMPLRVED